MPARYHGNAHRDLLRQMPQELQHCAHRVYINFKPICTAGNVDMMGKRNCLMLMRCFQLAIYPRDCFMYSHGASAPSKIQEMAPDSLEEGDVREPTWFDHIPTGWEQHPVPNTLP